MKDTDVVELTVILFTQKNPGDEFNDFTVGDIMEMKHDVLDHYVQLSPVVKNHRDLVKINRYWHVRDINNDLVFVQKMSTVDPDFL